MRLISQVFSMIKEQQRSPNFEFEVNHKVQFWVLDIWPLMSETDLYAASLKLMSMAERDPTGDWSMDPALLAQIQAQIEEKEAKERAKAEEKAANKAAKEQEKLAKNAAKKALKEAKTLGAATSRTNILKSVSANSFAQSSRSIGSANEDASIGDGHRDSLGPHSNGALPEHERRVSAASAISQAPSVASVSSSFSLFGKRNKDPDAASVASKNSRTSSHAEPDPKSDWDEDPELLARVKADIAAREAKEKAKAEEKARKKAAKDQEKIALNAIRRGREPGMNSSGRNLLVANKSSSNMSSPSTPRATAIARVGQRISTVSNMSMDSNQRASVSSVDVEAWKNSAENSESSHNLENTHTIDVDSLQSCSSTKLIGHLYLPSAEVEKLKALQLDDLINYLEIESTKDSAEIPAQDGFSWEIITQDPHTEIVNGKKCVIFATAPALVYTLVTASLTTDHEFFTDFLRTFRYFATSLDVSRLFIMIYLRSKEIAEEKIQAGAGEAHKMSTGDYASHIELKILNLFKKWISEQAHDFEEDCKLLSVSSTVSSASVATGATKEKINGLRSLLYPNEEKIYDSSAAVPSILDLEGEIVGQQLGMIEQKLFKGIPLRDFFCQSWNDKTHPKSLGLKKLINWFNHVARGVACEVVRQEDIKTRALVVKKFISTAQDCSYRVYRQTMRDVKEKFGEIPVLPYVGVNLSDLTFTEDGNPSFYENPNATKELGDPPLPLVNFGKMRLISQVFSMIKEQQRSPNFEFEVNHKVQFWVLDIWPLMSETDLYAASLKCEPRATAPA
ncbi:MAG: hypothetical protein SGCHY_004373 [Lobulomycetales sp.]